MERNTANLPLNKKDVFAPPENKTNVANIHSNVTLYLRCVFAGTLLNTANVGIFGSLLQQYCASHTAKIRRPLCTVSY